MQQASPDRVAFVGFQIYVRVKMGWLYFVHPMACSAKATL